MYSKASIYAHRKKDRKKAALSLLAILLISLTIALGAAFYWEKIQQQRNNELMARAEQDVDTPKRTPTEPQPDDTQEESAQESDDTDKQSETSEPSTEEETKQTQTQPAEESTQPEKTPVENNDVMTMTSDKILKSSALVPNAGFSVPDDYFDDAAFVGDSITEGIKLYEIMSNASVVAARGINLDTVFTDDQIRTAAGNTTVLGALEAANPKKIYIMFGANGVGWFTPEHFTKVYTQFVQDVKKQHPDSQIFLQSILPVTQEFDNSRDDISNAKINQYNELVVDIAEAEDVYYLDVASAIKDEKGCLPEDSNGDGMHFGTKYYNKWFDYLKTHTVS